MDNFRCGPRPRTDLGAFGKPAYQRELRARKAVIDIVLLLIYVYIQLTSIELKHREKRSTCIKASEQMTATHLQPTAVRFEAAPYTTEVKTVQLVDLLNQYL